MDYKKFLQALIADTLISEELAQQITVEASKTGMTIEDVIYRKHLLDEETVAKAKSNVLGIPYKKIEPGTIEDNVLEIIPEETATSYKTIPISLNDKMLTVGMVYPWDTKAQEALRFIAKQKGYNLGVYIITPTDLRDCNAKVLALPDRDRKGYKVTKR